MYLYSILQMELLWDDNSVRFISPTYNHFRFRSLNFSFAFERIKSDIFVHIDTRNEMACPDLYLICPYSFSIWVSDLPMRIPIQSRLATPHILDSIGIESVYCCAQACPNSSSQIRSNLIHEDTSFHLTDLFRISSLILVFLVDQSTSYVYSCIASR